MQRSAPSRAVSAVGWAFLPAEDTDGQEYPSYNGHVTLLLQLQIVREFLGVTDQIFDK